MKSRSPSSPLSLSRAAQAPNQTVLPIFLSAAALAFFLATPLLQAQTYKVLRSFKGTPDGQWSDSGLIADSKGTFYGVTTDGGVATGVGAGTVFKIVGTNETVLYRFKGYPTDGAAPAYSGLVTDGKGNFYGTTTAGGTGKCKNGNAVIIGCGTVFMVTSAGAETVLHSFQGGSSDGQLPWASLYLDSAAGILYGTTSLGGGKGPCPDAAGARVGCGTVFQVTIGTKAEKILYRFCSRTNCADGDAPSPGGALVRDAAGNFYGETASGGSKMLGAIFKLTPALKETVIYNFACGQSGCPEGLTPLGGLTLDSTTGVLYGSASHGGTVMCNGELGGGTVFQLNTNGTGFKTLYEFGTNPKDGCLPYGGVALDKAGNLYGTTISDETSQQGTVFELTAGGQESILHNFTGKADGGVPYDRLLLLNGNLYGTAEGGGLMPTVCKNNPAGPDGCGTVFEVIP